MPKRRKKPAPGRKGGRSRRGQPWLALTLVGLAVFAAGLYLGRGKLPGDVWQRWGGQDSSEPPAVGNPSPPAATRDAKPARDRRSETPPAPAAEPPPPTIDSAPAPSSGARVALILDDLGRSVEDVDTLGRLGVPLSYAVLPFESMTPQVVAAVRAARGELLCHLPMEPRGTQNPGPGALRETMTGEQLTAATRAALDAVAGATGANNHMGSELSADATAMRAILGVLAERKLFFVDSRTSAESRGYALAVELGVPAAERQVFLDGDPTSQALAQEWSRMLALARERGAVIAIGHPHPQTLALLQREVPRARQLGYEFVPVSYLLDRAGELPE